MYIRCSQDQWATHSPNKKQHTNVSGFNTLHVSSISMFFTMYRDISRKLASPIQVKNHGIWHFGYIHAQNQNV